MVCVMRLEAAGVLQRGAMASDDEVLVTGAAGGVGSVAVAILSHLGYNVVASTGRAEQVPAARPIHMHDTIASHLW